MRLIPFVVAASCGVAIFLSAGGRSPLETGLVAVSDRIADELIGGVDCGKYKAAPCGIFASSGCPLSAGYSSATSVRYETKPSGSFWCGAKTSCVNKKVIKSVYTCGSM